MQCDLLRGKLGGEYVIILLDEGWGECSYRLPHCVRHANLDKYPFLHEFRRFSSAAATRSRKRYVPEIYAHTHALNTHTPHVHTRELAKVYTRTQ